MKGLILKLEPVIWFLFGGGFMVGCLLFPAFIVAYGLAAPFGLIPEEAISYERMYGIASSIPGRLVLLTMIVFPLWNGLNHLRHFAIDLTGDKNDGWFAPLCYAGAVVGSVLAVVAVVRL